VLDTKMMGNKKEIRAKKIYENIKLFSYLLIEGKRLLFVLLIFVVLLTITV
jgi:hypothetical protein